MSHYSKERKEAILKLLLPPHNLTVAEVAKQENISDKTLYNWRNIAKKAGQVVPGKTKTTEDWSVETKLAVIVETATFTESQLSQYCRANCSMETRFYSRLFGPKRNATTITPTNQK